MTHVERAQRRSQILQMLKDGFTPEQVVRRFNVGVTYVRMLGSIAGLRRPRTGSDLALRILASILNGQPFLQIAAQYGVTKQYVYSLKDRAIDAGIQIPGYGAAKPSNLRGPGRPSRAAPTARAMKSSGAKDA
jgi:DNA-binding CsgD family transcriptional regulator